MKIIIALILTLITATAIAQPLPTREIRLSVFSSQQMALPASTVSLLKSDSTLLRTNITDSSGIVVFTELTPTTYLLRVTRIGHKEQYSKLIDLAESSYTGNMVLQEATGLLQDVTVTARKPFVQILPDKTIVNVEAGITNAGATVLEVLERSPGVTVDRNGVISLKGRPGVQIMIDGKVTQLSGTDLQNLLTGMSASQIETIELMDNPSAKYDAAGNAGIINIRTKKTKQRGFNGSVTTSYGQGIYPKNNNNIVFNYRNGKFNYFFTYSMNLNQYMMDMYALRTYYKTDGTAESMLEQPYFTKGTNKAHTLRTGADYFVDRKTTIGVVFTGTYLTRNSEGKSTALWMNAKGEEDSTIHTNSASDTRLKQAGLNFNARHVLDANREITADVDFIKYDISTNQYFENQAASPGSIPEAAKGHIPTNLDIFSAKTDYTHRFAAMQLEAGLKTSRVNTRNPAQYFYMDGAGNWQEDLWKTNHFLYTENIHAAYANVNAKAGRWTLQGGLRYELTAYKATQLGNTIAKDSSFDRNYGSLFPTLFVTWKADSVNSFTFRTGRRIDRPAFQKLNPFVFIINKYTYQTGNPYFKPQYTWNAELSHIYKDVFSTTISYNIINDYFSQIFYADSATSRITYSEGNVGKMQNVGLTMSAQLAPAKWWSFSGQATLNHKRIEGMLWKEYKASITQLNMSVNNQFRFKKGWGAELSGFYTSRAQNDLQEVLDPTGQVSLGFSKQVMKNKGTLRLTVRDVFYTQSMAGWTYFNAVIEYFKLMRDSRVGTISFTYRFGKAMKQQARRNGAAGDEVDRVGTVN